jgi:hypothetical protein
VIRKELRFIDITRWRERLGEIEAQVCRVEVAGGPMLFGTAFLVGPDLVLTNHHVVASVLEGSRSPRDILLRFDYRRASDGVTLNEGTTFQLPSADWLLASGPPSPVDWIVDPGDSVPDTDHLDYALLRLEGAPGREPVNFQQAIRDDPPRGWLMVPTVDVAFEPDTPLFIVQHPSAGPLKLALDTRAVVGLNANRTRVRYRTNTEHGSSGSPCFDADWKLVALHHGGDPNFDPLHRPEWNEGIPISAIYRQLPETARQSLNQHL